MYKSDVVLGEEYAFRRTQGLGTPFKRVRALNFSTRSKGKVRVLVLDEPTGDEETWVSLGQLHAPWSEAATRLEGERRMVALLEESDRSWDPATDDVVIAAVNVVLAATGYVIRAGISGHGREAGVLRLDRAIFDRICFRARIAPDLVEFGEHALECDGEVLLPFGGALRLTKHFAAAEPAAVVGHIGDKESVPDAYRPWERVDAEDRAAFALAREWADDGRLPEEIAEREAGRVGAAYAEVLHGVAALGVEHRRFAREAGRLLSRCLPLLRGPRSEDLGEEIRHFLDHLENRTGRSHGR